jgi:integrase
VTRRLCTIAGFYRYAVEEELLGHSPAAHVRRPRLDYESDATGLDRNELGALLVAAGLGPSAEHALISLLALNGLRVSEATGVDIEAPGMERGHRTLVITRKGGKIVTVPLAPRTARAIDLAVGERCEGPIFLAPDGRRLDRHGAARIVRRITRRAGIAKPVGPHTLRHAFIAAALDAGVPLRDVQEAASHADPRTTMRYDRARASLDRHATYIVAAYVAGAARQTRKPELLRLADSQPVRRLARLSSACQAGQVTQRKQHKPHEPPICAPILSAIWQHMLRPNGRFCAGIVSGFLRARIVCRAER